MSLGGKDKIKQDIPAWAESLARETAGRASQTAGIGYMPWTGPDVAGLNAFERQAMDSTNSASSAYGLGTADYMADLPEEYKYSGGMTGYSAYPLFSQAIGNLETIAPNAIGQYDSMYAPNNAPGVYSELQMQPAGMSLEEFLTYLNRR